MNKKQLLNHVGARLEQLRLSLHLSKDEMAVHLNMTRNGYTKNERGLHLPALPSLLILSKNFDISMDWLLFEKGPVHFKEKPETPEPAAQVETPAAKTSACPQNAVLKAGVGVPGNLPPGTGPGNFDPNADYTALEPVAADVQKLLAQIAVDPQFRYEVLAYLYKYIREHPES